MAEPKQPVKGPASRFPSIEAKHGRPFDESLALIRPEAAKPQMELFNWPTTGPGIGHGHANMLVAHVKAARTG